jgi:predicted nucleic acid-binding protein
MDKDDAHHETAWETFPHLLTRFEGVITTNHVIGETYTLLRSSLGYRKAWEFMDLLSQSRRLERLFTPENMEEDAYRLLKKYADQDFSFVDATSFVWMRILRLREAFAFDKHFRVMGFSLPRF